MQGDKPIVQQMLYEFEWDITTAIESAQADALSMAISPELHDASKLALHACQENAVCTCRAPPAQRRARMCGTPWWRVVLSAHSLASRGLLAHQLHQRGSRLLCAPSHTFTIIRACSSSRQTWPGGCSRAFVACSTPFRYQRKRRYRSRTKRSPGFAVLQGKVKFHSAPCCS